MNRPVHIGALAARDLQQARDWFDGQEQGLGDKFLASVEQALDRIQANPEQYAIKLLDLRAAPVRPYKYSLWYRILPDASIVVAALSDRRDLSLARRRAMRLEPL